MNKYNIYIWEGGENNFPFPLHRLFSLEVGIQRIQVYSPRHFLLLSIFSGNIVFRH